MCWAERRVQCPSPPFRVGLRSGGLLRTASPSQFRGGASAVTRTPPLAFSLSDGREEKALFDKEYCFSPGSLTAPSGHLSYQHVSAAQHHDQKLPTPLPLLL